ncbi:MAG: ATP-grasp domain-containing protein [Planctomycetes bacterium]|nr:ATP-grasp domain-containing protein [Planctomycetota bacterium]
MFLNPGFPAEMPFFVAGLAEVGATVVGVGDMPKEALPERCRRALSNYIRIRSLFDEEGAFREIVSEVHEAGVRFDRIETLWEPLVMLAARLRQALGVPGLTPQQALPFRDKELMKQKLDAAGIRTPRHSSCSDEASIRAAAERIGYPLMIKPIDGAGSADTHRVNDASELGGVIRAVRHVPVVSVEEFVCGREYTFDAICAGGRPLYYNIAWYRPRPLIARTVEWISPQVVALRNPDQPELAAGRAMGFAVLKALEFEAGYTHMEWYLKDDGEVVFGEIGARVGGARLVDQMNYSVDADLFRGWAEAVCFGTLSQPIRRRYNVAVIFKRAQGEGRIARITGLASYLARFGQHVAVLDLLGVGEHRRNWLQTLISDGYAIVRHPNLETCLAMADRFGTDVQLFAE